MEKSYMCTNCYWVGPIEQMLHSGDEFNCPDCLASFNPDEPEKGPWEPLFDGESDPNFDDSDWDGFDLGEKSDEGSD